jgi:calcium binding protein 39
MPLFGKSQKSPAELVRSLKDAVTALERGDKKAEKAQEDVSKNLVSEYCFLSLKHTSYWQQHSIL